MATHLLEHLKMERESKANAFFRTAVFMRASSQTINFMGREPSLLPMQFIKDNFLIVKCTGEEYTNGTTDTASILGCM
jgi:hypothetical protein